MCYTTVGTKGQVDVRKWALALCAAGTVFLLAGCGQLMNLIYPSNVISMDVRVLASAHPDWASPGSMATITLASDAGQTFTQSSASATFDGAYAHYLITVSKLPNEKYTIVTSYTSGETGSVFYASPAPDDFFDPAGTELNLIQMPYTLSAAPTNGHSVLLSAYIN